ncbi:MAG: response regulator transcription factor [Rubripirellula sp.]
MDCGATVYVIQEDAQEWEVISNLSQSMGYRSERFSSTSEFLHECEGRDCGCIVTSLLPGPQGLEVFEATSEHSIPLPVIVTAAHPATPAVVQAMRRGAVTLLEVPLVGEDLRQAIAEALSRNAEQRERMLLQRRVNEQMATLSEKETKVMELMILGLANKVIAKRLAVSVRTVESRRHDVFEKMHVGTLAELVRDVITTRQA